MMKMIYYAHRHYFLRRPIGLKGFFFFSDVKLNGSLGVLLRVLLKHLIAWPVIYLTLVTDK